MTLGRGNRSGLGHRAQRPRARRAYLLWEVGPGLATTPARSELAGGDKPCGVRWHRVPGSDRLRPSGRRCGRGGRTEAQPSLITASWPFNAHAWSVEALRGPVAASMDETMPRPGDVFQERWLHPLGGRRRQTVRRQ
jgi:hypothetical protein